MKGVICDNGNQIIDTEEMNEPESDVDTEIIELDNENRVDFYVH